MSSRIRASAACGSRIAFRRAAAASRWKLASLICATSSAQAAAPAAADAVPAKKTSDGRNVLLF